MPLDWSRYRTPGFFDELIAPPGRPRPQARRVCEHLASLSDEELRSHKLAAEVVMRNMGITFTGAPT